MSQPWKPFATGREPEDLLLTTALLKSKGQQYSHHRREQGSGQHWGGAELAQPFQPELTATQIGDPGEGKEFGTAGIDKALEGRQESEGV